MNLLPRRSEGPSESPEVRELARKFDEFEQRRIEDQLAALRERVERGRRDAEDRERATTGGPCIYCGVSRSAVAWQGNPGRLFCIRCADDRWDHPDVEHKSLVLQRILADDWSVRRFQVGDLAKMELEKAGFKWFCEVPGAIPGGWHRWAYLDLQAVRERAAPPPEQPRPVARYTAGDPCHRCGCAYLWTNAVRTEVISTKDRDFVRESPVEAYCAGCVSYENLSDVVKRIVGVWGVISTNETNSPRGRRDRDVAEALGVTWYADRPVRTNERARGVTLTSFAYLDLEAIRRKAFEYFPHPSQWTVHTAWAQLSTRRSSHPLGR